MEEINLSGTFIDVWHDFSFDLEASRSLPSFFGPGQRKIIYLYYHTSYVRQIVTSAYCFFFFFSYIHTHTFGPVATPRVGLGSAWVRACVCATHTLPSTLFSCWWELLASLPNEGGEKKKKKIRPSGDWKLTITNDYIAGTASNSFCQPGHGKNQTYRSFFFLYLFSLPFPLIEITLYETLRTKGPAEEDSRYMTRKSSGKWRSLAVVHSIHKLAKSIDMSKHLLAR